MDLFIELKGHKSFQLLDCTFIMLPIKYIIINTGNYKLS